MGKQTLIIGMAGTFNAALASEIVKQLSAAGLQVHHASVRYDNQVHFATGGPDDLKESLREYGTQASVNLVENSEGESTTLAIVHKDVQEVLAILKRHEPKPPKEKKKGGEKGTPETTQPPSGPHAGDPATLPEGQPEEKPADDPQPSTADDKAKAPDEDTDTTTDA